MAHENLRVLTHRLLLFLLFLSLSASAQFHVRGVVRDDQKKPLAFASIATDNGIFTLSDLDGKFDIVSISPFNSFTVSYVGFAPAKIEVTYNRFQNVILQPKGDDLAPVTISDERAVNLIKNAIAAKPSNDPQRRLSTFEFKAYNKLVITASADSIDGRIDSIFNPRTRKLVKVDSSDYKFKKVIARQHLFQTEKVSQYQFADRALKETVLATKMSGFKRPIYEILAFNLQSFSIYDDKYELFETLYKSPLSNDYPEYRFKLLDSTDIQGRKTYLVYFKNKKKRKAAGLEGVLYIDAQSFAVARAVMRIRGLLDISGTHDFEYLPDRGLWFPSRKTFKILKGKNSADIRVLGETLKFDADDATPGSRPKFASDFAYVLSETRYFERQLDVPLAIKHPSISVEIADDAINKPEAFWNRYRNDSLDVRSRRTYEALDSLSRADRIESRLLAGRKILNGYVAFGPFDLDLRYLVSYNNYEGFRLGLGGRTNEKFSRRFRLDGYTAYGIKDGMFKYSLGGAVRLGKFSNSWIGASYTDDLREIGSTAFATDRRIFKIYGPRPINVSTFYQHKTWRGYIETRLIPKTESIWQLNYSDIEPKFSYLFRKDNTFYDRFTVTTAQASIQWNPFSDYMQTPHGRLEVEKRFPKFTFQFTQSLPHVMANDFTFTKFDFRTEYEKKYLNGQKTQLLLEAGYALGDVPLTHLYNTSPNNLTKDNILQRVTLAGKNAFETMYFNEFFSSKFAMLQVKHGFKRFKLARNMKPEFILVSRAAFGGMDQNDRHIGLPYKTLEDGYYESGFELNQIYSLLGLNAFYRYGPNQLPRFEDNIAIKLSIVLNLGF